MVSTIICPSNKKLFRGRERPLYFHPRFVKQLFPSAFIMWLLLCLTSEPLLHFNQSVYHIRENDVYLHAAITRSGGLYLLCYCHVEEKIKNWKGRNYSKLIFPCKKTSTNRRNTREIELKSNSQFTNPRNQAIS